MNVKPGDIARTVSDPNGKDIRMDNRNKLVTVVKLTNAPRCCFRHTVEFALDVSQYGVIWDCETLESMHAADEDGVEVVVPAGSIVMIPDANLRPLPGVDDGKDEPAATDKGMDNVMQTAWEMTHG